ncbi:hypothetical protein DES39_1247 [Orbus hercynius]|uniref:Uncharacterized protein n=1 Tax=Orbus hercynius TaxID=593135 RepID=A0A495REP0_9GAMM|nr:hypothetical protein [Orbus hercynius]RKS85831.1 hypothetical protein DES39_1247 [Orbus hercynius]
MENKEQHLLLSYYRKINKKLPLAISPFLIVTAVLPINAVAITAKTAITIQGQSPYIWDIQEDNIISTLDELLIINVPNSSGSSTVLPSAAGRSIDFPADKTFNDIMTKAIVADNTDRNFSSLINYYKSYDNNGDTGGDISGTIKAVWKNNGEVITTLDSQPTKCSGPYTLTVSVTDTAAKTQYGDPRLTDYGTKEVTYTFKQAGMGICYLQPLDLTTFPAQSGLGGGYNSTVFDPDNGFLATNKEFPGTAFKGAGFYILGSGQDQSKYKCSIVSGATDSLKLSTVSGSSGQNCYIEYTSTRPTSDITIELAYEIQSGIYQVVDNYTLKRPNKWMTYQSPKFYFTGAVDPNSQAIYPAANVCAGNPDTATMTYAQSLTYFYSMQDITNVPLQADGSVTTSAEGRFTRTLDKTFMGVWGNLYNNYPNSDFYSKKAVSSKDGVIYETSTFWVGPARSEIKTGINAQYVVALTNGLGGWQERANVFACKETIY